MNLRAKLIALTLTCISPLSSAAVIDFEGFSAGTIIDNEYQSSLGVSIFGFNKDRSVGNLGVVFDTDNYTGGDSDLASPFSNDNGLGVSKPGNVLILHEHPQECNGISCIDPDDEGSRPAGYFDIAFSEQVMLNSIDFFDFEAPEAQAPNNRIELFDQNDVEILINSFFSPDTGGDNKWERLIFDVEGISRVRVHLGGSGAIDNIKYVTVSEPYVWFLFSVMLGFVALVRSVRTK